MARLAMRPAKRLGLMATPAMVLPEAASQTFVKGAVIVRNAGYAEEGGVDPTEIVGVADEAGNNTASAGTQNIGVTPALPSVIFEASVDDNTDLGNATIAATDVGERYGITEDAAGIWYVDKGKTAEALQRVIVERLKDAAATVQGRVYIRFLQ